MTWNPRANELFLQARELPAPADRVALLDRECVGDTDLRAEVEALLAADGRAADFLERPVAFDAAPTETCPPMAEGVGTALGPYKLLQVIGEGGMGTVFMAEQTTPVRRRVALKIIKAGIGTKQGVARFEAERQALALMDHPNIAKVFDAGTTPDGRPYFVMELVKGTPITTYCDDHKLAPRDRLTLFADVCRAVQHAHQKGIIHRDLKPSNVLVAPYDGKPVVKVIDFGVAKAAGQLLTDKTLFTEFGAVIGTLEYMSPEQAELNNQDVDTRSDVYSIGVLLYELLTGTTPLDRARVRKSAFAEVLRLIREEEPPRPSMRLSAARDDLPTISAQRQTEPAKLARLLRGELDWIVMKALEKDRNRRYETANGLALDVERYLAGEPVQAVPPSVGYRLRKLIRRNKGPVLATSFIFLALIGGVIGTTIGLFESKRQERLAHAAKQKETERAESEAIQRRRARKAVDEMYVQVAEKWMAEQSQMQKVQLEFLHKALRYYEEFSLADSVDPQERLEAGSAYFRIGQIQDKLGDFVRAEAAYRQAISVYELLVAEDSSLPVYRHALHRSNNRLGGILFMRSEFLDAERTIRRSVDIGRSLVADFADKFGLLQELATSYHLLGMVLAELGNVKDAEQAYRTALDIKLTKSPDASDRPTYLRELASEYCSLGILLTSSRRFQEAEQALGKSIAYLAELVKDFRRVPAYKEELAVSQNNLALLLKAIDRRPEALTVQTQALEVQKDLATDFPDVPQYRRTLAASFVNLAIFLKANGQLDKAEAAYRDGMDVAEKLLTEFQSNAEFKQLVATCHFNLGNLLRETDRSPEAEKMYERAMSLQTELMAKYGDVPVYRRELSATYTVLGLVLLKTNRPAKGHGAYRTAIEFDPGNVRAKQYLSWSLATCSDPTLRNSGEAVKLAKEAVEQVKQSGDFWMTLGVAQYRAGEFKASLAAFETATRLEKGNDPARDLFLAMVHWKLGNQGEARKRFDRAVAWMEKNQSRDEVLLRFRAEAAEVVGIEKPAPPKKNGVP